MFVIPIRVHYPSVLRSNDASLCMFPCSFRYLTSLFWAVVVTTGIGWDIIPVTTIEILFTTAMVVFGLILYAVIVGSATVKICYDIRRTY